MVVRAKFIGSDGSLGYKTGQVYNLLLEFDTKVFDNNIYLTSFDDEDPCIYSSLKKFLDNWEVE